MNEANSLNMQLMGMTFGYAEGMDKEVLNEMIASGYSLREIALYFDQTIESVRGCLA